MYICHNCGHRDYSDTVRKYCPVCGADLIFPKWFFGCFCSFLAAFLCSMFPCFDICEMLSSVFTFVALVTAPFAIMEIIKLNLNDKDYITPEYPSDVLRDLRIPKFKKYEYVSGNANDYVKNIMIEPYKHGLNVYHEDMPFKETIDYDNILEIDSYNREETKITKGKSMLSALLLGAFGGIGLGVFGGLLNSFEVKNKDILKIQYKNKYNETEDFEISAKPWKLHSLEKEIKNKIEENNDNKKK